MTKNLDIKDKKLIYHLSINARESHTQLAKKVGLSKNSIKYRIQRLQQEGIIKHFSTVVNLGTLDITTFTILLKFNDDIYENKSIINYFKEHEFADWVTTLSGEWDIFAEFVAKDINHLYQLIREITNNFNKTLNTYQVFLSRDTIKVEHLIEDFYANLKLEPIPTKTRKQETIKIDKTDKKILNLLGQDSSLQYHDIAEKLKLTMDVVRYRMKNLIKNEIIIKFFPEISLPKLGYTEYLYTLKLKNLSKEKLTQIRKTIEADKSITYAFIDINSTNIIFVCAFKSPDGIDTISRKLRNQFPEAIEKQKYLIIKDQIKFNLFPHGLI